MPQLDRLLPPTADAIPPRPTPRFSIPEDGGETIHGEPSGEAVGEDSGATTEKQNLPLTMILLTIVLKVAKGDPPSDEEIALVNPPLTAVVNKYNVSTRWMPEIALFGALLIVVQNSRRRASERIVDTPQPQRDRADDPLRDMPDLSAFVQGSE